MANACSTNFERVKGDVDRTTRRRILDAYLSVSLTLGPAYALFFAFFGAWWSFVAPAVFTLMSIAAWELKRRNVCHWATGLLLVGLWFGPAWAVLTTGAIHSPLLIWLTPTPFMAGALLGRRAAVLIGGVSASLVVLMGVLPVYGVLPLEMNTGFAHEVFSVLAGGSAVALLTFYGWTTTRNFEDAQHEISEQHSAVVAASAELSQRNADMKAVLDNVSQGLLMVDLEGRVLPGHSAVLTRWFGEPPEGGRLWDFAAQHAPTVAAQLELGWEDLRAGFMPVDVILDQLPSEVTIGASTWSMKFQAVGTGAVPSEVLLVMSDITQARVAERAQASAAETLALFERYVADPATFASSRCELDELIRGVSAPQDAKALARRLHTIKGTSAACGLVVLPPLVHRLESILEEEGSLDAAKLEEVQRAWRQVVERTRRWADASHDSVVVHQRELDALKADLARGASTQAVLGHLERWRWERIDSRFQAFASQASALATRLGKPGLEVTTEAGGLVVPPGALERLWLSMVHVVRNAVDHGIERPELRVAAGKSPHGHLRFAAREVEGWLELTLADDGAGIDWQRVADKARSKGLPAETRADLEAALLSDGFSTKDQVTDVSGRGVGLSATLEEVKALGGRLRVESTVGAGTRWIIDLPRPGARLAAA